MLSLSSDTPRDEATYNAALAGLPEVSGIRQRLNTFVEELNATELSQQRPEIHEAQEAPITKLPITSQESLAIAIPLYIYPAEGAWVALRNVIARHESTDFHVIINPANGPGGRVPDSNYIKEVALLNSYSNCRTFGYVHVSWGNRKLSLVQGDIATWSHWKDYAQADIHVEGIFVDEAPANVDMIGYMTSVYNCCKNSIGRDCMVWTNPGVQVDESFHEVADLVNSHENTYRGWQETPASRKDTKSTTMIHTYTGSIQEMDIDLAALRRSGCRAALITTSNCYTSFSRSLDEFVAAVERLNNVSSAS